VKPALPIKAKAQLRNSASEAVSLDLENFNLVRSKR
jgi:hypothetical protein